VRRKSRPVYLSGLIGVTVLCVTWFWISSDLLWDEKASTSVRLEVITKSYSTILIVFGLGFAYRRLQVADRQARVAEEGQLTQRFGSAVEHLASEALSVRIGGLYSLERLSKDSTLFHWPVVEIISAFVKDRSIAFSNSTNDTDVTTEQVSILGRAEVRPPAAPGGQPRAPLDVQVAMRILSRRDYTLDAAGQRIDLEGAYLAGIRLSNAALKGANLNEANLNNVTILNSDLSEASLISAAMVEAELRGVDLRNTNASWVKLTACNLQDSDLRNSEFQDADLSSCGLACANAAGASFRRARVDFADFTDANLTKASFEGVDCSNTAGLSTVQLSSLGVRPRIEPTVESDA